MSEKQFGSLSSKHPALKHILEEIRSDEMPAPRLDSAGHVVAADKARVARATGYVKFSK